MSQSPLHIFNRYKTLYTHRISALPVAILMPHSACNCKCVMCDIWKDNKNLKQLTEGDISGLLTSFRELGTRLVVMSGGEALLNPNFFTLCRLIKERGIRITLLSTGLLLKKHAENIVKLIDEVIVSLDGDEPTHDRIRNIPGCYGLMKEGIEAIRALKPGYKITARTVIHKLNFDNWPGIIDAAKRLQLQQVSFLPADISSSAFNREVKWDDSRQAEVMLSKEELPKLKKMIEELARNNQPDFDTRFIAESPTKLLNIYYHYAALHGLNEFPRKRCNAPWVSAVVEADGTVRPCFFHDSIGNIRANTLNELLNSRESVDFRKNLDLEKNDTCRKCVCYLNLPPLADPTGL
jgi:MoaA/NifB/PqqE/SkfB family radical SAM enzyme